MARKAKLADLVCEAVKSASQTEAKASRAETVVKESVTAEPLPARADRDEVRGEGTSPRVPR
jgi:hypothetical protein